MRLYAIQWMVEMVNGGKWKEKRKSFVQKEKERIMRRKKLKYDARFTIYGNSMLLKIQQ